MTKWRITVLLLLTAILLSACVLPLQHTSPDSAVFMSSENEFSDAVDSHINEFSVPSPYPSMNLPAIPEPRIAVLWYALADSRVADLRNALIPLLDSAGYSYREYDAENDRYSQLDQVKSAVVNGWNILVVNLVADSSAMAAEEMVQAASGCPVIFFDRVPQPKPESLDLRSENSPVISVAPDAEEIYRVEGQMVGTWLTDHFTDSDLNADGQISYTFLLENYADSDIITGTQQCIESANELLSTAGFPALSYFQPESAELYQYEPTAQWPSDAANNIIKADLSSYGETNGSMIELILSDSAETALGALTALQSSWYNLGDGVSVTIPLFGIGATAGIRMAIELGQMTGTVDLNAAGVADAVLSAIHDCAAGKRDRDRISVTPLPFS